MVLLNLFQIKLIRIPRPRAQAQETKDALGFTSQCSRLFSSYSFSPASFPWAHLVWSRRERLILHPNYNKIPLVFYLLVRGHLLYTSPLLGHVLSPYGVKYPLWLCLLYGLPTLWFRLYSVLKCKCAYGEFIRKQGREGICLMCIQWNLQIKGLLWGVCNYFAPGRPGPAPIDYASII